MGRLAFFKFLETSIVKSIGEYKLNSPPLNKSGGACGIILNLSQDFKQTVAVALCLKIDCSVNYNLTYLT